MTEIRTALLIGLVMMPCAANAQSAQPYAGLESRQVKALSDGEIADLKAGRGMGLALAAELNGYPGPAHVLELANRLPLSEAQRNRIQQLFDAMKAEAVPLGEQLIEREARLDRSFASKTITEAALTTALEEIGSVQASLRATHLKYHLETAAILTSDQMQRYAELRGYGSHMPMSHQHGSH